MLYRISLGLVLLTASCGDLADPSAHDEALQDQDEALRDQDDDEDRNSGAIAAGRRLFTKETFGGNGRTCRTCHGKRTGTLSPEEIQALFRRDPNNVLFRFDGSDDGAGHGVSRILQDATILINIALPPNVHLADDPGARFVTLRHGIPSVLDTPALDPVLMYDGRAPDLVEQARGAIDAHTQHTVEPTERELELIAEFERSAEFFSSGKLRRFAAGGSPPRLPEGHTAAERRGRRFIENVPFDPVSGVGVCALCHSGPMLNEANGFLPIPVPPGRVEPGTRFANILSSELASNGDPVRTYVITNPDGSTTSVSTSDPGRALQTGDFRGFPLGDLGLFKTSTLWNVKHTAPYFHNSSMKSLEQVLQHYTTVFQIVIPRVFPGAAPLVLSAQDQADIVAFLMLLD